MSAICPKNILISQQAAVASVLLTCVVNDSCLISAFETCKRALVVWLSVLLFSQPCSISLVFVLKIKVLSALD